MKRSSEDGNGSTNIQSKKRTRSGTLQDLDLLDCPICSEPFAVPIFQCENGHLACHVCCPKLSNKCHSCAFPIGTIRCRAMEKVLESVVVPCKNAKLGCTKIVPYDRELNHENDYCKFSLCSCPDELDHFRYTYTYTGGSYNDVYNHYLTSHLLKDESLFHFGKSMKVQMKISDKTLVLTTIEKKVLFVVQCIREPNGVYVTVNGIAPLAPEIEKFCYRISCSSNGQTFTHARSEMKKIRRVSFEIPNDHEKDYIFLSNSLLRREVLEVELCIWQVE